MFHRLGQKELLFIDPFRIGLSAQRHLDIFLTCASFRVFDQAILVRSTCSMVLSTSLVTGEHRVRYKGQGGRREELHWSTSTWVYQS